ncbi:MAG TPA: SIS domain-containing protein [Anaerolineales bacterium]
MQNLASHTYLEITQQPYAWRGVVNEVDTWAEALVRVWKSTNPQEVIFIGCGSTYYLARSASAVFRGVVKSAAQAIPASDLLLFPEIAISKGVSQLLVAISRSGETTETLRAIEQFRALVSNPVLGVTCYADSVLAQKVDLAVVAREAHEKSIAQTRSFSSMLLATQLMALILAGERVNSSIRELPEMGVELMQAYDGLARRLAENLSLQRFFFLGSGQFYGLACEVMLKMKEMSLSNSEAFHFLEFRHGPMSMVDRSTLMVGLLSEKAFTHEVKVLKEMRDLGAKVLAITPRRLGPDLVDEQVVLPGGLNDNERGPLYLPVLQLLAYYRSVQKGLDPDKPTHLSAVVNLDLDPV